MLAIISPAKTLDFLTPSKSKKYSQPSYLEDSQILIESLRKYSTSEIADLMRISPKLAELNRERYTSWQQPFTVKNAKQAILAFKGDVYVGLDAETFNERDFATAQKQLRILSGLYGLLKPLDLIQPYRLEMGTNLKTIRGKNLYKFWQTAITKGLQKALNTQQTSKTTPPALINLASNEYFNAINKNDLNARIITPTFKDMKNGSYKFISFFAKKARGLMASYIVKNKLRNIEKLRDFDYAGYYFSETLSKDDNWVFLRDEPL